MILDSLNNYKNYLNINPLFKDGFDFLINTNLKELTLGDHILKDENLIAKVAKEQGKTKDQAKLEAHKKYIDIQFVISGTDNIGWSPLSEAKEKESDFNFEKDFVLFKDTPQQWITVPENHFVIFFPNDAHAPMVSEGILHKVILKVKNI